MKPIVVVILVVSIIGNLIGAYIFYKALKLREEVKMFQRYHHDLKEKYEETKADFPGLSVYAEENKRRF
jgi:formate/nitrite transporter FocA (FNT family)